MSTLWYLSGIVSHKDFSKTFAYLFCDVNLQNCCGAEGRGASVFGLDHQWPYAVFVVCDVVDDVQRSDIGFQLDFPSALVYVKHIGWICLHDGIIHNVVGFFCILVYSLVVWKTKVLLFVSLPEDKRILSIHFWEYLCHDWAAFISSWKLGYIF